MSTEEITVDEKLGEFYHALLKRAKSLRSHYLGEGRVLKAERDTGLTFKKIAEDLRDESVRKTKYRTVADLTNDIKYVAQLRLSHIKSRLRFLEGYYVGLDTLTVKIERYTEAQRKSANDREFNILKRFLEFSAIMKNLMSNDFRNDQNDVFERPARSGLWKSKEEHEVYLGLLEKKNFWGVPNALNTIEYAEELLQAELERALVFHGLLKTIETDMVSDLDFMFRKKSDSTTQ